MWALLITIVAATLLILGLIRLFNERREAAAISGAQWEMYTEPNGLDVAVGVHKVARFPDGRTKNLSVAQIVEAVPVDHPEFSIELELSKERVRQVAASLNN